MRDTFFNDDSYSLLLPNEEIQTNNIKIMLIRDRYEKSIYQDTICLKDIVETIDKQYGNVNITDDKQNNQLWSFGECKDPSLGRVNGNIIRKGKFFMVDYDNGYSIQEFEQEYKKFFYMLYTSYSHTDQHHKFRVILYGNYDKPLNNLQQKSILKYSFRNADNTTLQPNRFFYLPAHKENSPYEFRLHYGRQFPLWNIETSRYCMSCTFDKIEQDNISRQRMSYVNKETNRNVDCMKMKSVRKYLDTPYTKMNGNGDSDMNLFKALFCCEKWNDRNALANVVAKARSEGWTTKEIEHKLNDIKVKIWNR